MFQFPFRRGVEVWRVYLDKAVEELGDEIGSEVGMLSIRSAQNIDECGEVCGENSIG